MLTYRLREAADGRAEGFSASVERVKPPSVVSGARVTESEYHLWQHMLGCVGQACTCNSKCLRASMHATGGLWLHTQHTAVGAARSRRSGGARHSGGSAPQSCAGCLRVKGQPHCQHIRGIVALWAGLGDAGAGFEATKTRHLQAGSQAGRQAGTGVAAAARRSAMAPESTHCRHPPGPWAQAPSGA
jgi:hypothetical protein